MEFKRYEKYLVLKRDDITKYLNDDSEFWGCVDSIEKGRIKDGKELHTYVVVNEEMPYAETVWKLIEEHELNPTE